MNVRTLALCGIALLAPTAAQGQFVFKNGSGGGGGSGTVTSITAGNGISVLASDPCTTDCTIATTVSRKNQTGTSYNIQSTDGGKIITGSNGSAIGYSLAQANTAGFTSGFGSTVSNINAAGGQNITITATTSTFGNGTSTLVVRPGQVADFASDGTNYPFTAMSLPLMADSTILANNSGSSGYGFPVTVGTGILTWLSTPSSANLAAALTDKTGSGAVVFANTPTLVTPVLGVAGATTLAVNGCTIGSLALCINGNATITSGDFTVAATADIIWSGRGRFTSPGIGFVQIGGDNSSSPTAYTLSFQSGSGTNIAGQNSTIVASVGTGNANSGDLLFQTGGAVGGSGTTTATPTTALRIRGVNGRLSLPLLSTDATLTTRTICQDTSSSDVYFGSGTAGICLGTSSARYKHDIASLSMGLGAIMALKPVSYRLNKDKGDPNKTLYGFLAEDMAKVTPHLVGYDKRGRPDTADYVGVIPILVKAVQEQQQEIAALKKQIAARR